MWEASWVWRGKVRGTAVIKEEMRPAAHEENGALLVLVGGQAEKMLRNAGLSIGRRRLSSATAIAGAR